MPRGTEPDILLNLFGKCDSILEDGEGVLVTLACCVQSLSRIQPEAKTH